MRFKKLTMNNFIKLFFLLILFEGFSQGKFVRNDSVDNNTENLIYGYIKGKDVSMYAIPEFGSKVLKKVNKGDSIKIYNYYQGEPYTKILFWMTKVGKEDAYINDFNVENEKLNSFKEKIDSLRNVQFLIAEKEKEKEKLEQQEIENKTCDYEKNEKDPFDNIFKKYTIFYEVAGYSLRFQLRKYNSEFYLVAKSYLDLGCSSPYANDRSYMKIKLLNDKVLTFYHRGDIDCSGFRIFARITNNEIHSLKQSPIKSVRLSGTDYYNDIENVDFKNFFIDKLKCIE